jgi:hypothetical protein
MAWQPHESNLFSINDEAVDEKNNFEYEGVIELLIVNAL